MHNLMRDAQQQIRTIVSGAIAAAQQCGDLPAGQPADFDVEVPKDTKNGDFSTNAAMVNARTLHMAPRQIATAIQNHMQLQGSYFASVDVAGPGFINFTLQPQWFSDTVLAVLADGENYGKSNMGQGKKIDVEYVSANPTGPMHLGNARGGSLGDGLAEVLSWAGYDVTREFYVNDAGNQIEKFGKSLSGRYMQHFKGAENVPFGEDLYQGGDIIERVEEYIAQYGDNLLNKSEEERSHALIDFALPKNIAKLTTDLQKYRVEYDIWFKESTLHQDGSVQRAIDQLIANGYTYEKEGAIWYKNAQLMEEMLKKQGKTDEEIQKLELKDDVLVRANGIPTYFAADIAYHYNKLVTRGFDRAINIWGADHHGHVARMKCAMMAMGLNPDRLDIVLMQLVNLVKDGKPVRMSKRTGKAIALVDLLDEVPLDSARFFFNMREPGTHLDFDLDLAIKEDSTNPVYYVQYAHARICSIVKALAKEGVEPKQCSYDQLNLLTTEPERELVRHLATFTDTIEQSAVYMDSSRITRYVMDTAALFHKFYNACRVKGEEENLCQARLALCLATRQVIKNVLNILKISAPETM